MLSTVQKARILGKAGYEVPLQPPAGTAMPGPEPVDSPARRWVQAVEILYATYAAARAAKSLREAEEARQTAMLRRLSSRSYA
jgi:hypothetical protein